MTPLTLTFVGSGDAFASGGRLQSAIHLASAEGGLLLDCGATLLTGLHNCQLTTNQIDSVIISHLHGDHFGGLPFLLLEALFVQQRRKPLNIYGPPGLEERISETCHALYPGALDAPLPFALNIHPYNAPTQNAEQFFRISSQPARHGRHAAACSFVIELEGRRIAYSGDTEWHAGLLSLAANSDLFICECCTFDQKLPGHINYLTLKKYKKKITAKQIILTHTGAQIDSHRQQIDLPIAHDGLSIKL
ncbi:MAG: MBL fold metallo-hydrolase [Geopsychrobacter sp.]|nr:MBL fold metallo-hydrolase [Geopsychrobacter sp.]